MEERVREGENRQKREKIVLFQVLILFLYGIEIGVPL